MELESALGKRAASLQNQIQIAELMPEMATLNRSLVSRATGLCLKKDHRGSNGCVLGRRFRGHRDTTGRKILATAFVADAHRDDRSTWLHVRMKG